MNNCEWEELYLKFDFHVGLSWKTGFFPPTHGEIVFPLRSRTRVARGLIEKSMVEKIGYFHQAGPSWMYNGKLVATLL